MKETGTPKFNLEFVKTMDAVFREFELLTVVCCFFFMLYSAPIKFRITGGIQKAFNRVGNHLILLKNEKVIGTKRYQNA